MNERQLMVLRIDVNQNNKSCFILLSSYCDNNIEIPVGCMQAQRLSDKNLLVQELFFKFSNLTANSYLAVCINFSSIIVIPNS